MISDTWRAVLTTLSPLILPHKAVTDRETRERSSLLAGMQLTLILISAALVSVALYIDPKDIRRSDTQAAIGFMVVLFVLYIVNRLRYVQISAAGFILLTLAVFLIPPYLPDGSPWFLAFATVTSLIAGVFFRLHWVVIVSAFIIVVTFILNRLLPVDFWDYQYLWYFQIFSSILTITLVAHQNTVENIRRQHLEESNQRLRESEELLEKRVEERTAELQTAYQQVQSLVQIKDEFVANVSHELRTPITSIKIHSHLLEHHIVPSGHRNLQTLNREVDRLKDLIESLLLISRLDQDRIEFQPEPVDLTELVQIYVQDRIELAEQHQLQLVARVDKPLIVRADAQMLGQVLSILLTNAINYTPSGGLVTVSTRFLDGDQWAGFSVQDNGPGIPPDEQTQLFTRFFRGQSAYTSGVSGTGLGLSIAREIIDRHQGIIKVESAGIAGDGSTFTVLLPNHRS